MNLPERIARGVADYQKKMARYLDDISRLDGLKEWSAGLGLPVQCLDYFEKVLNLYDESVHFLVAYLRRQGFTIRCDPECSHCCFHMPTGISSMEFIYLYYGMHQSGTFPRYFRRCLEAEELWEEVLHRNCGTLSCGSESESETARERRLTCYFHLEHPCPFLERGRCQVYSYRPLACRMHFSLSPPHWCHPSHFQNPHAVQINLEAGKCVYDALERLDKRLHLSFSDVMVCGLLELTVNVMQFQQIRWVHRA